MASSMLSSERRLIPASSPATTEAVAMSVMAAMRPTCPRPPQGRQRGSSAPRSPAAPQGPGGRNPKDRPITAAMSTALPRGQGCAPQQGIERAA